MKLELKHIAPYSIYNLKWYRKRMDSEPEPLYIMTNILREEEYDSSYDVEFNYKEWLSDLVPGMQVEGFPSYMKPVLRPLSDLVKEIEHNGERFVPVERDISFHFIERELCAGNKKIEDVAYMYVQKLFEWHFDVHGLIKQNLAIDINTIK